MMYWICVGLLAFIWFEIATLRHGWRPHARFIRSLLKRKTQQHKEYV